MYLPLGGRFSADQRLFQFDDLPVLFFQLVAVLHVVLHQLRQSGELFAYGQKYTICAVLFGVRFGGLILLGMTVYYWSKTPQRMLFWIGEVILKCWRKYSERIVYIWSSNNELRFCFLKFCADVVNNTMQLELTARKISLCLIELAGNNQVWGALLWPNAQFGPLFLSYINDSTACSNQTPKRSYFTPKTVTPQKLRKLGWEVLMHHLTK